MASEKMKILIIPGSNRTGSYNGILARIAEQKLSELGVIPTLISLRDYALPIMDQDLEKAEGGPENAKVLADLINSHEGLLLVSPEYNSSLPPLLKNTIDWVSRLRYEERDGTVFNGKPVALMSASPGRLGGIRMLPHLRAVMQTLGANAIPAQLAVGSASHILGKDRSDFDKMFGAGLEKVCRSLIDQVRGARYLETD